MIHLAKHITKHVSDEINIQQKKTFDDYCVEMKITMYLISYLRSITKGHMMCAISAANKEKREGNIFFS